MTLQMMLPFHYNLLKHFLRQRFENRVRPRIGSHSAIFGKKVALHLYPDLRRKSQRAQLHAITKSMIYRQG
jgi:hypothetical protein